MTAKLVIPETAQFVQLGGDPAAVSGKALVYSKPVGGVAQLFVQAGDGVVAQVGTGSGAFSPPERWAQVNIAASQTNVALSAQVSGNTNTIKMAAPGSIVGLITQLTEAITAGTLTVTVTKNGSPVTLSAVHTSGLGTQVRQAVGIDTYVAGDVLGVQLTTDAGFLPITTDIEAWIQCSETVAGTPGMPILPAIGGIVTGATDGSVFYASGTSLAQDNSNLYYDATGKRLGIGTSGPSTILDIAGAGNTAAIALRAGASAALSVAGTARLRFNQSTNKLQVSENGGAYADIATGVGFTLDIADAIGSSTIGSVLFVGAGNDLQQDNANFFWDDTNNRLGIGNAAPAQALHVTGVGRFSAGITLDTLTTGSVLFSGASGTISQDNANLFWDDTNNRLGIGVAAPSYPLEVEGLLGNTPAKFGPDYPIALVSGTAFSIWPSVGFAAYYNGGWRFAEAAAGTYSAYMTFDNSLATWSWYRSNQNFTGLGSLWGSPTLHMTLSDSGLRIPQLGVFSPDSSWRGIVLSSPNGTLQNDLASDALIWHATTQRLCLGTNPTWAGSALEIRKAYAGQIHTRNTVSPSAASGSSIRVAVESNPTATGHRLGGYNFGSYQVDITTLTAGASIEAFAEAAWTAGSSHPTYVTINTAASASATPAERMRISSTGVVSIAALTTGSVPFIGAAGAISQDNARFFWNDTNKVLQLSTNHATTGPLNITATASTAPSAIAVFDQASGFRGYWGWFNSGYSGFPHFQGRHGVFSYGADPFVLGDTLQAGHLFGLNNTGVYHEFNNGQTAAVSTASTGRIRYNTPTQRFQASMNAGSYFDVATYAASLTTGSIVFANSSGQLAQDNANFFWDDTNNRLGIGIAVPTEALHVVGNTYITGKLTVDGAIDPTSLTLEDGGNAAYYESADGQSASVSPANRGRLRYNVPSQTFQMSLNGAAYADIGASTPDGKLLGRQIFTASGTYTPTAGTTMVRVRMVGGGGGGGGADTNTIDTGGVGGGGASGTYFEIFIDPGVAVTGGAVTIGAAGSAGSAGATGGTGGDSSIVVQGTTYTAKGGLGGSGQNDTFIAAGRSTSGGAGQAGSSSGDVVMQETGQAGIMGNLGGTLFISGKGGSSPLGAGGREVRATSANGNAGQGYGAGGSGGVSLDALTASTGGAGTAGLVIVEEYTG